MPHRVVKIELKPFQGMLLVRALGGTGRGTKFLIAEHAVPQAGRTKEDIVADVGHSISTLLGAQDDTSL